MAEVDLTRKKGIAYFGVQRCALCFVMGLGAIFLAIAFRPFQLAAIGAFVLPICGFFCGGTALLCALWTRSDHFAAAFAGLILNGLLAVGIFDYVVVPHRGGHSQASFCLSNLKMIQGAKATWAAEFKKTTNDIPDDADLFGENAFIRTKPTCPGRGTYTIGTVGERTACSIPGHTL